MDANPFVQLAISLLLGLLVGLQRERAASPVAGIRTFPLIAAFGTLAGWLALEHGGWIVAAGALALAGLLIVGSVLSAKGGDSGAGQTTEVAALLLYGIGAYLTFGETAIAVALGGVTALLLHYREPMHGFAARIGERDVTAIMQFVLITLVILPVLPNETFGPYAVLNPFEIWLMVVLIVGISLVGYVAYKIIGEAKGAVLGGLIGGLVSSTATTVSVSRRVATARSGAELAALVIMIASGIVFARVIAEIAIVTPGHFREIAPPLAAMLAICALIAALLFWRTRQHDTEIPPYGNPANLRMAMTFGGLYALVVFAVAATKAEFGAEELFIVAILSGLTDMDAITLSTSQLVNHGRLEPDMAWRMILLASLANLAFKGALAAVFGGRALVRYVVVLFGAGMIGGIALLWLWPAPG